jgi:hypothetical protein
MTNHFIVAAAEASCPACHDLAASIAKVGIALDQNGERRRVRRAKIQDIFDGTAQFVACESHRVIAA